MSGNMTATSSLFTKGCLFAVCGLVATVLFGCLLPRAQDAETESNSTAAIKNDERTHEPGPPQSGHLPMDDISASLGEHDGRGRWREFRTHRFDTTLTEDQRRLVQQLEAIGYMNGSTEAPDSQNVTVSDENLAHDGLNFYTSGHGPEAILMDMKGRTLHQWAYDFWRIWPDYPVSRERKDTEFWRCAYLFENGDILAVFEGLGIIKLDKDSNLIWANPNRAHHDLEVLPSGEIFVLTREARLVPRVDPEMPILEDFLTLLDVDGQEKGRVSLLECFENSEEFRSIWLESRARQPTIKDIFHTNSLQVLEGRISNVNPAFKKGNILTSMLTLDTIAVLDLEQKQVVWAYKGDFRRQHDPHILANCHLLLFDNQGMGADRSRVLEYDPATMTATWEYHGTDGSPFYSRTCGTSQRLPNGNTLITESDNGRAFEITADETIVWEFYNPHRAGDQNQLIATLFEMIRLPPDFPIEWADHQPQD